ncbi:MAG TPA: hydantoinase/carbamoylase family amidase, partial [Gemmatimonadales bacterium]
MNRRDFVQQSAAAGAAIAALPRFGASGQADWQAWRVNGERVNAHLAALSAYGMNPEGGVSRMGFSDADVQGRGYVIDLMRAAGLDARIDQAGNILGTRPATVRGLAKPILFGSHIDSVPHGGNYDGDVGSLSAIEVAQFLMEKGYKNRHPLMVTVWCDEESGLTGSRGFLGDITPAELAAPGRDGVSLADKIRKIGGDPEHIALAKHEAGSIAAYVELHIEQGGVLEQKGLHIGIVEGIVGINHYDCVIAGFANHAGTTPMDQRQNALL